jgi:nicotinate-nucleotide adenylyltransferase
MTMYATWPKPPGPVAPGLRIGLLGGSFNPAHEGHMHVSEIALKRLGLDYVWWLVSPQNPLKPVAETAPLQRRMTSAREIAGRHPRLRISDIETRMGTRFTVDTVTRLKERFPQVHFVWLMGSDNLLTFHRWRNWQRLASSLPIAIVLRPGAILAPLTAQVARQFAMGSPQSERMLATACPPALAVLDAKRSNASATALRRQRLGWLKSLVLH